MKTSGTRTAKSFTHRGGEVAAVGLDVVVLGGDVVKQNPEAPIFLKLNIA